ncbi:MAG TPA: cytochrome c biogenesis protein ResB [Trebonia sp.]|nr:cytochrome c biogenesis protein ResB [Trebonia sp.]
MPLWRWAWRQITSMRTALVLLFLLALGAIPGSIIPQTGNDPAQVQQYFISHPALAPWLSRFGLFDVYGSPWFAAIYLLLFISLVGCVVPRTFRLVGQSRTPPPKAPRFLGRLPHSATYVSPLPPQEAVAAAASVLGGHHFRLRTNVSTGTTPSSPPGKKADAGDKTFWLSAEKGYLREAGNLLFHLSLLGILICVAVGGLFGYKADKLLVEGQSYADTPSALDDFYPGRLATGSDLAPFDITLNNFTATYITSGQNAGQPAAYNANVTYTATSGGAAKTDDLQVNHPLNVDGVKVYLIGHGFAPVFSVTDAQGKVVYDQATPFIPADTSTMLSDGVVKAPNAAPEQLGFMGVFVPTAVEGSGGTLNSAFPAAENPAVSLIGYSGNLGMDSGLPQSVYQMDTTAMTKVAAQPHLMFPGQTWKLPNGLGSITFVGYKQWVSLTATYDPGQGPALAFAALALLGILVSFVVRRRRVFVRAVAADGNRGSILTVGGLARTDASGGFEEEFARLAAELAGTEPTNQSETGA